MREVYSVVLEAQIATIQACKAGIICEDLHAVSRRIIDRAGLGEYYNHGVGHGVFGPPQVAPGVRRPLVEGMVITVEPGVYIPGYGGVRIEDTVAVTSRGCHVLHTYTRDLIEM
jgi:Xaa-Pro aminopeptidase